MLLDIYVYDIDMYVSLQKPNPINWKKTETEELKQLESNDYEINKISIDGFKVFFPSIEIGLIPS